MKFLSVILLCGLFCSGKLENVASNVNIKVPRATDNQVSIGEGNPHPVEDLQTFQDSFYGIPERNLNSKPCVHNEQKNVPIEEPATLQHSLSNRRSNFNTNDYNPSNKLSSYDSQPREIEDNNQFNKLVNDLTLRNPLQPQSDSMDAYNPTYNYPHIQKVLNHQDVQTDINSNYRQNEDELAENLQCANKTKVTSVYSSPRRFLVQDTNGKEAQELVKQNNLDLPFIYLPDVTKDRVPNNNARDNLIKYLTSENSLSRRNSLDNQNINNINDPIKGQGVTDIKKSGLMLMDYDRICYACSSTDNPTCLTPDRRTTVKYCRKGVNTCSTKTYKTGSIVSLIRDCGTCDDSENLGFNLKYKSCSICHSDLCNSAYSNNISLFTLFIIGLITIVKVTK